MTLPEADDRRLWPIPLLAAALFLYVALRAVLVPFTHDESFSFLVTVGRSFRAVFTLDSTELANNHLLNSILARACGVLFGPSAWALRLPNVLAFGVYLWACLALSRRLASPFLAAAGFVLLTTNPFLLEFFSLQRGYGLGLGFFAAALHFALRIEERPDRRASILLAGCAGSLAIVANLAFVVPVGALALVAFVRNFPPTRSEALAFLGPPLVLAAALGRRVLVLRQRGQFYAGGSSGFWRDTVGSLVDSSLAAGPHHDLLAAWVRSGIAALFAGALVVLAVRPGGRRSRLLEIPWAVAAAAAAWSIAQHALLGTPFLVDRMGIFFVPLLALVAAGTCDALAASRRPSARAAGTALVAALALSSAVSLATAANLDRTTKWGYDADVTRAVADLGRLHERRPGRVHLGGSWILEPALNFYRVTGNLTWLDPVGRREDSGLCDALYVCPEEVRLVPSGSFTELVSYPTTGNRLFVRSDTAPPSPPENSLLTGAVDSPSGDDRVPGDLLVRGWARIPGEDLEVSILVDGFERKPSRASRVPRADVASAVPDLGDCSAAGFEITVPFHPDDRGDRLLVAVFRSRREGVKHLPGLRITWAPPDGPPGAAPPGR